MVEQPRWPVRRRSRSGAVEDAVLLRFRLEEPYVVLACAAVGILAH